MKGVRGVGGHREKEAKQGGNKARTTAKCNTNSDGSTSEVGLGSDHDSKTLIHITLLSGTGAVQSHSQLAPRAAPYMLRPSPGGCTVR